MKKRFSGPQIVSKLRQADVLIGQGKSVPEVCKEIEISQQTYYRWRQMYGGLIPDMIDTLMQTIWNLFKMFLESFSFQGWFDILFEKVLNDPNGYIFLKI